MPWVNVCREQALAPGHFQAVEAGGQKLLVFHLDDGFYATQARCTHIFASLAKGRLVNGSEIQCPLHRARFDVRSGAVREWACFPPGIGLLNAVRGEKPLATWPVRVLEGWVQVDIV